MEWIIMMMILWWEPRVSEQLQTSSACALSRLPDSSLYNSTHAVGININGIHVIARNGQYNKEITCTRARRQTEVLRSFAVFALYLLLMLLSYCTNHDAQDRSLTIELGPYWHRRVFRHSWPESTSSLYRLLGHIKYVTLLGG